jgi:hypothetical protein
MLGGRREKARRGELGKVVPRGFLRRPSGEVVLESDEQVQATIRLIFDLFDQFRTVGKVVRYLVDHEIGMPRRIPGGPNRGDLEWRRPNRVSLQDLLRNPIYAGVYVYGRRVFDPRRRKPGRPGTGRRSTQPEEAEVFLLDRLPAYISWERYQANQMQLRSNRAEATGIPRAGQALLSGLLICGRCGLRMTAHYNHNGTIPRYACIRLVSDYAGPVCQTLKAAPLDALVTKLVLEALEPAALEASLMAASELERERATLDAQWRQRIERADYQVDRARRQFNAVEPENRLVGRTLERQWEQALAEQARMSADYQRFQSSQPLALTAAEVATIRELAGDLPGIWSAATQEERQALVRLLLERVLVEVVDGTEQVQVTCHWHGSQQTAHRMVRPVGRVDQLSTYRELTARATELRLAGNSYPVIARTLNQEGWRPAKRRDTFNALMVQRLVGKVGIPKHKRRRPDIERQADEWTIAELARHIGMPESTLYGWVQEGRLQSREVCPKGKRFRLVHADEATIAAFKRVRATPAPWRRLPPPIDEAVLSGAKSVTTHVEAHERHDGPISADT